MDKSETLDRRLLQALGIRTAQDELSDNDLREAVHNALHADVPGFEGIAEILPESQVVIYVASPETELMWFRRSFSLEENGSATLKSRIVQVEPDTKFEPVAAEGLADGDSPGSDPATADGCGCNNEGERHAATPTKGDSNMSPEQVKELVGRLIASEHSPFIDEDADWLADSGEKRLEAMLAKCEALQPHPIEQEPVVPAILPVEEETPLTEDEWMAEAPESLRSMVTRYQAEDEARRSKLVVAISEATGAYTPEQLQAKPTEELQQLSKALKLDEPVRDFSGRGLPVTASADEDVYHKLPDTWGLDPKSESN